jgi:hypothetical protein
MPLDMNVWDRLNTTEMPDLAGAMQKGMGLRQMGMQQDKMERDNAAAERKQKALRVGQAMDQLASLPPEQRSAAYPKVRAGLLQEGVIDPAQSPEQHDEQWFTHEYAGWKASPEFAELDKTRAEAQKLRADAHRKEASPDDWLSRMEMKDQFEQRKKQREMEQYSKVGSDWKLAEGATPTPTDAKAFKTGISDARALMKNLNEYQALVKEYGSEVGGKIAQRMDSLVNDIQLQAKNESLYKLGVLTGPDKAILDSIISAPTGVLSKLNPFAGSSADNKAEQFRSMMNSRIDSAAKTYGFEAQPEWTQLAQGGPRKQPNGGGSGGTAFAGERHKDGLDTMSDAELAAEYKRLKGKR